MRCRLSRTYRFEAAHHLPRVPPTHKCHRVHGHSYHVEVLVEGEVDEEMGWLMDFAAIDEHVAPRIARLDHRLLNELPGLSNPTSEHLARWLWVELAPDLPMLVQITVSETPHSQCIYRGE